MDEDPTFKTKFNDPFLNFLSNFGVFFYYFINRMINKDNEKGIFFAKIITPTMDTENNRQINFNAIINVFPIRKKRILI